MFHIMRLPQIEFKKVIPEIAADLHRFLIRVHLRVCGPSPIEDRLWNFRYDSSRK
jgi:hypothetical protein